MDDLRDQLKPEQGWSLSSARRLRGDDVAALAKFGVSGRSEVRLPGRLCQFAGRGRHGPVSRLCCRDMHRSAATGIPKECGWRELPKPGLSLFQMMEAARAASVKALYVVGSNPDRAL